MTEPYLAFLDCRIWVKLGWTGLCEQTMTVAENVCASRRNSFEAEVASLAQFVSDLTV